MSIIFYTILFIIGIIVGNYLSIKSIEIPKKLDMRKKYYNDTKKEKIISKITYIFLGGILSLILAYILRLNVYEIDLSKIIIYIFSMIFISVLILIAGIDRLYLKIEKSILTFGIITSIMYMLYLCIVDLGCIYANAIYLATYIILLIIDTFLLRRYATDSYIINVLLEACLITSFTDLKTLTYTLIMTTISIIIYMLLSKIRSKKKGNIKVTIKDVPIGYFLASSNIIILLMIRIFENCCIY